MAKQSTVASLIAGTEEAHGAFSVPRRHLARARRRDAGYLLSAAVPASAILYFIAWPAVHAAIESVYQISPLGVAGAFAGLANFTALLQGGLFWPSVSVTTLFALPAVALSLGVALGLALLIRQAGLLSGWVALGLFSPTVIPAVAAANIWLYMLIPQFGAVDRLLSIVGLGQINWLGEPTTTIIAFISLFVWKYAPYYTFFLVGAVQRIPADVREAAALDGAGAVAQFRHITLPLLRPMLAFLTIIAIIAAVQTIDPIYVMTQGGPNNTTNFLTYYLYQLGFNYFSWGQAAALSVIMVVVLGGLSALALVGIERGSFEWQ